MLFIIVELYKQQATHSVHTSVLIAADSVAQYWTYMILHDESLSVFVVLKETLMWWSSTWNPGKRGRNLPVWISPSTTAASTDRESILPLALYLCSSRFTHSGGVIFLLPWQPVACWLTVILLKTDCGYNPTDSGTPSWTSQWIHCTDRVCVCGCALLRCSRWVQTLLGGLCSVLLQDRWAKAVSRDIAHTHLSE